MFVYDNLIKAHMNKKFLQQIWWGEYIIWEKTVCECLQCLHWNLIHKCLLTYLLTHNFSLLYHILASIIQSIARQCHQRFLFLSEHQFRWLSQRVWPGSVFFSDNWVEIDGVVDRILLRNKFRFKLSFLLFFLHQRGLPSAVKRNPSNNIRI